MNDTVQTGSCSTFLNWFNTIDITSEADKTTMQSIVAVTGRQSVSKFWKNLKQTSYS